MAKPIPFQDNVQTRVYHPTLSLSFAQTIPDLFTEYQTSSQVKPSNLKSLGFTFLYRLVRDSASIIYYLLRRQRHDYLIFSSS